MGKRVRILREGLGLNQKELTKLLNDEGIIVQNKHISDIERDQRKPSVTVLAALADALGTTADYLLVRSHSAIPTESEPNTLYIAADADQDILQRLVDIFSSLSRADQQTVIRMAEGLRATDTPRIVGE